MDTVIAGLSAFKFKMPMEVILLTESPHKEEQVSPRPKPLVAGYYMSSMALPERIQTAAVAHTSSSSTHEQQ